MAVGSASPVSIPAMPANQEAAPLREVELEKVKQHLKRCTRLGAAPGDALRLVACCQTLDLPPLLFDTHPLSKWSISRLQKCWAGQGWRGLGQGSRL